MQESGVRLGLSSCPIRINHMLRSSVDRSAWTRPDRRPRRIHGSSERLIIDDVQCIYTCSGEFNSNNSNEQSVGIYIYFSRTRAALFEPRTASGNDHPPPQPHPRFRSAAEEPQDQQDKKRRDRTKRERKKEMDPDTPPPSAPPSAFNYILSFILVGLAWGFTTPFIRRAAVDFNKRQEAKRQQSQYQNLDGGSHGDDSGSEGGGRGGGKISWLRTKLVTLFWTVVNLLRTPAYAIPLVLNLTGSVWFFLLVGKHGMSSFPSPLGCLMLCDTVFFF